MKIQLHTIGAAILLVSLIPHLYAGDKPLGSGSDSPAIHLKQLKDDRAAFEVSGLPDKELSRLKDLGADSHFWVDVLAVYVKKSGDGSAVPAMLGTYHVDGKLLVFEPRFPLTKGLTYRVVLEQSKIPRADSSPARIEASFSIAKPDVKSTTVVDKVFPTTAKLPENQLKFYLHFSAPMTRGDSYRNIHLLDEKGKEVDLPFLEIGEELWDPEGKRLTLLFDPGRIKKGVKPREDEGPPLHAGKTYTLRIDHAWQDAQGNPLKEDFVRKFSVTEPIEEIIDLKKWKWGPPAAGSTPLTVRFPRPLDNALLHRMLWVTNEQGDKVAGTITVSAEETTWQFQPAKPWKAGKYQLTINKELEDLAGNSVAAPFEVDVVKPIQRESKAETAKLPFEVK